jgi:hypothetical protein
MPVSSVFAAIYPPPTFVKHPIFWNDDADLFLSIRGLVFGVHRHLFRQSLSYHDIFEKAEEDYFIPRGEALFHPLPFDNLPEETLIDFLYLLYDEESFDTTTIQWKRIRRLSVDWGFTHQASVAITTLLTLRQRRLPLYHRKMLETGLVHCIFRRHMKHWKRPRLPSILVETEDSDDEMMEIVEDDSI